MSSCLLPPTLPRRRTSTSPVLATTPSKSSGDRHGCRSYCLFGCVVTGGCHVGVHSTEAHKVLVRGWCMHYVHTHVHRQQDALFRFKLVQKALAALLDSSSEPYKVVATTYTMTFACIYVVGTSCLFAWSFERARVHHFKLNPFTPRYWRLVCRRASFSPQELAGYASVQLQWLRGCDTAPVCSHVSPRPAPPPT